MNRKSLIIWSCVLIVLGIVLCTTAIAIAGLDFTKLNTNQYQFKTELVSAADVSNLRINLTNNNIGVVLGESEQFKISYYEADENDYKIYTSGNELVIMQTVRYNWIKHIGINFSPTVFDVLVELPQSFDGDIDFKLINGEMDLKNISIGKINANLTNGDIVCENSIVSSASFKTQNGNIKLITVTGAKVHCNTVNGDIKLRALTFDDFDLKTVNGDIEGTVSGAESEYIINAKTTLGDNNLFNNTASGGKTFTAKTTSGDINIKFDR